MTNGRCRGLLPPSADARDGAAPRRPRTGGREPERARPRGGRWGPRRGDHVAGGGPAEARGSAAWAEEEDSPDAWPVESSVGLSQGRPGAELAQAQARPAWAPCRGGDGSLKLPPG